MQNWIIVILLFVYVRPELNLEVAIIAIEQEEANHFVMVQSWKRSTGGSWWWRWRVVIERCIHIQNQVVLFDADSQIDRLFDRQSRSIPRVRDAESPQSVNLFSNSIIIIMTVSRHSATHFCNACFQTGDISSAVAESCAVKMLLRSNSRKDSKSGLPQNQFT